MTLQWIEGDPIVVSDAASRERDLRAQLTITEKRLAEALEALEFMAAQDDLTGNWAVEKARSTLRSIKRAP